MTGLPNINYRSNYSSHISYSYNVDILNKINQKAINQREHFESYIKI